MSPGGGSRKRDTHKSLLLSFSEEGANMPPEYADPSIPRI